jgi:hypothetical protein
MTSQVRVLINVTVVWFSQKILVEGTDQAFNVPSENRHEADQAESRDMVAVEACRGR